MDELLKLIEDSGSLSRGELLKATVIHHDDDLVYLDIGSKQEGICPRSDFNEPPIAGSEVEVLIQKSPADGPVRLSKREADRRHAWQRINEAFEAGVQLSGVVARSVNHGYIVKVDDLDLFLPLSQSTLKIDSRRFAPGKKLDVKILELKEKFQSAIVSHRAVIEERNEASWNSFMEKYNEGDEVEGAVNRVVSFGVFIQIDDMVGLLHQSDISWKKHVKFKNRFKLGDSVRVKIMVLDRENNRISLGLKQLAEDPWEWAQREIKEGDTIKGKVINLTDYGAFVEIREGLEGLVHITELSWARRTKHPKKYLALNQEIEARVLGVNFEERRLSLGIRQLQKDPWDNVKNEIKVGDIREGKVVSLTKFGTFVSIAEDVEGLIHFNDYTWDDKVDRNMLKKGDEVKFKILDIKHDERRISCGIKQLSPSPYELLRKKYKNGAAVECEVKSIKDFGIFVEFDEGIEGLIHSSNIPMKDSQSLSELFAPGQKVTAVVQKIDAKAKKIALSIKAFERKQEREIISKYLKNDKEQSTSSLGAFLKNINFQKEPSTEEQNDEQKEQ